MVVSACTDNAGKAPQRSIAAAMNLNNSLISAHLQDHNKKITKTPFQGWLLTDEGTAHRSDCRSVCLELEGNGASGVSNILHGSVTVQPPYRRRPTRCYLVHHDR